MKQIGLRDVLVGSGILLTALGAGLIYLPAGILTAGCILLLLGTIGIPSWR